MKIEPSATRYTQPTKKTSKVDLPPSSPKPPQKKSADIVKQKISMWFTQVGLSPNAEYVDYNARSIAARRHQDIRNVKRAENLNKIMALASTVALADVSEESVDPDWFYAFIDLAENIYTPTMQELWSKILAVEVSRPGSFSLRSLETLRKLTQREAQLFSDACKLVSRRSGDNAPRIILNIQQRKTLSTLFFNTQSKPINLGNYGLSYPALLSLVDLGLIMPSEIESAEFPVDKSVQFRCGESNFDLTAKKNGVVLTYYKFTTVGTELFLLSRRHENNDYVEALKQTLSQAFNVTTF